MMSTVDTRSEYDIASLSPALVGVKPYHRDWSDGYPTEWEFVEAARCGDSDCPAFGEALVGSGYAECPLCGDEHLLEGPMMSTAYPIDHLSDPESAAGLLADLPLCVVTFADGNQAMALTGGGMDLSWEISEGYMALGYLPPVHFARLPRLSGYPKLYPYVLEAMLESLDVTIQRAASDRDHVLDMLEETR